MKIIIIGGCGFIGFNNFLKLKKANHKITIIDDLSGNSSKKNFALVKKKYPNQLILKFNIKNYLKLKTNIRKINPDVILFAGGQIAVTKSIINPREDFNSTLLGAFNVLEVIRQYCKNCKLIYLSSNKVYGKLKNIKLKERKLAYKNLSNKEIDENTPLDFASPYGCSKGSSDQYVRDYSRSFNLNTTVFRLSCIYGQNQWGTEDQGWISWFIINSLKSSKINIFGNGKQVRDILHINDLVSLIQKAVSNFSKVKGEIFNIGGGRKNSISLIQLILKLQEIHKKPIKYSLKKTRIGDQNYFVNDLSKIKKKLKWFPIVTVDKGLINFSNWIQNNIIK